MAEQQRAAERDFDTSYAPTYDADDAPMDETHRRFVQGLLGRCPRGGRVLDAACGTGKYFGVVLAADFAVSGVDRSAGMLARAAAKFPSVARQKAGRQDLPFAGEFDAVMCVDAMEYMPPEQWPVVLERLVGAARPGGSIYLTVERTDPAGLALSYAEARDQGLPMATGEQIRRGEYHYYPELAQVRTWLQDAGLNGLVEAHSPGEQHSYSYQHFLGIVGSRPPLAAARSSFRLATTWVGRTE
ncbi:MAG: class I SAM-dependent methyltransferase [Jatrophihabitans sp.]|uniref:class I SAM-dependent methyltransferase n=1 Tax=Jatrophihabitans sp. TaxID=1932789 RepID=UPI0039107C19